MNKQNLTKLSVFIFGLGFLASCASTESSNAQTNVVTPPVATETKAPEIVPSVDNSGGRFGSKYDAGAATGVKREFEVPNFETTTPITDQLPAAPEEPQRPLTPTEIAKEIAPNFDVAKDYPRLVQCYGKLDFLSAMMRVRANKAGAPAQLKGLADNLTGFKEALQPFVLASSTVKSEAKFRTDYNAVAEKASTKVFSAADPDKELNLLLKEVDTCRPEAAKWAGVK